MAFFYVAAALEGHANRRINPTGALTIRQNKTMPTNPLEIAEEIEYSVHKHDEPRRSGEPYVVHPDRVATLILELPKWPEFDFRLVDVSAAIVLGKLHDVPESLVKQEEKNNGGRFLDSIKEEKVIDEAKAMIVNAFRKAGYELNDRIGECTTVADLTYDADSLTHRRYWREGAAQVYGVDRESELAKEVAYDVGHRRLMYRTLMAQPSDPMIKRMTAVLGKTADTLVNMGDSPKPERKRIYDRTLPELLWLLKSEAERITRKKLEIVPHGEHAHNVVPMPKKPFPPEGGSAVSGAWRRLTQGLVGKAAL